MFYPCGKWHTLPVQYPLNILCKWNVMPMWHVMLLNVMPMWMPCDIHDTYVIQFSIQLCKCPYNTHVNAMRYPRHLFDIDYSTQKYECVCKWGLCWIHVIPMWYFMYKNANVISLPCNQNVCKYWRQISISIIFTYIKDICLNSIDEIPMWHLVYQMWCPCEHHVISMTHLF